MYKLYEKNFNKFENNMRVRLGNFLFLTKYIKRYSSHIKIYKRLLIPSIILGLSNGVVYISRYFTTEAILLLISGISFTIAGILSFFQYFAYRYHHFQFIRSKIDTWSEELKIINESNQSEI